MFKRMYSAYVWMQTHNPHKKFGVQFCIDYGRNRSFGDDLASAFRSYQWPKP